MCVKVTIFDGMVMARLGFNPSCNSRSVMAFEMAFKLKDVGEKRAHMQRLVDGLWPGR